MSPTEIRARPAGDTWRPAAETGTRRLVSRRRERGILRRGSPRGAARRMAASRMRAARRRPRRAVPDASTAACCERRRGAMAPRCGAERDRGGDQGRARLPTSCRRPACWQAEIGRRRVSSNGPRRRGASWSRGRSADRGGAEASCRPAKASRSSTRAEPAARRPPRCCARCWRRRWPSTPQTRSWSWRPTASPAAVCWPWPRNAGPASSPGRSTRGRRSPGPSGSMPRAAKPAFSRCSPGGWCAASRIAFIPAGASPPTRRGSRGIRSRAPSTRSLPGLVWSRPAISTRFETPPPRSRRPCRSSPTGGRSRLPIGGSRCWSGCRSGSVAGSPIFCARPPGRRLFRRTTAGALRAARGRPGGAIAVWASRMPAGLAAAAERDQVALLRVEDGFIRSVGLGSDFVPAASLVLDSGGMHYDPDARSDLERLLLGSEFDAALLGARRPPDRSARGPRHHQIQSRAAAALEPAALAFPRGRRRILVPGQVEDDLSVRLGGGGVRGNLDLLGRVRGRTPTPSSSTSRIPTSRRAIARAPSPTGGRANSPTRSCATGRRRRCSPTSTNCTR